MSNTPYIPPGKQADIDAAILYQQQAAAYNDPLQPKKHQQVTMAEPVKEPVWIEAQESSHEPATSFVVDDYAGDVVEPVYIRPTGFVRPPVQKPAQKTVQKTVQKIVQKITPDKTRNRRK